MSTQELLDYVAFHSHCSAIFKVADDFSDVWFGHNTWTSYNKLIRIYKEYKYVPNPKFPIKAQTITMSSYPAAVNSQDDFYITGAYLYVGETTNHVYDESLFDLLTPNSLMCWMRTMLANRLTDNGYSWIQVFSKFNSGTYNNQFQILDLKLIDTEKKVISPGAMYIVEQLPGSCDYQEVTDILKKGYWPSYNTPFIEAVREKSGVNDAIKKDPSMKVTGDYYTCARAKIFRREQSKVKDIETYKNLIESDNQKYLLSLHRYNTLKNYIEILKKKIDELANNKYSFEELFSYFKKNINQILEKNNIKISYLELIETGKISELNQDDQNKIKILEDGKNKIMEQYIPIKDEYDKNNNLLIQCYEMLDKLKFEIEKWEFEKNKKRQQMQDYLFIIEQKKDELIKILCEKLKLSVNFKKNNSF
jgi:hypothetical protein